MPVRISEKPMARYLRTTRRTLFSSSSSFVPHSPRPWKHLSEGLSWRRYGAARRSGNATSTFLYSTASSPFTSNMLRLLGNEIQYQIEYAPPHQPATKFKSFTIEDHPGEQWITIRGKFGDDERIKMEATMFDGFLAVPKVGEDSTGQDVRLHISLLVDISKGDGRDEIEFVCSVWPDSIEIQKAYVLRRDQMPLRPYMGPDFRNFKNELGTMFQEFLRARGVNDELCGFLHEYMMNKDRTELIQWLRNLESFVAAE